MSKVIKLTPTTQLVNAKSTFNKQWGIVNPTVHVLKYRGRNGETSTISPTISRLDRSLVYVTVTYKSTGSCNFTPPSGFGKYMKRGQTPGSELVTYTLPIEEILNSEKGVYVEELDIVIGTMAKDLEFPKITVPCLQISSKDTIIHQFFIVVDEKHKGHMYVWLVEGIVKVPVVHTVDLVPGLYCLQNELGGSKIHLIDLAPIYAKSKEGVKQQALAEGKKINNKKIENVDMSSFNQFMGQIVKQATAAANKVVDVVDEETKARDVYRKEHVEEEKNRRASRLEIEKQTNESIKSINSTMLLLAKVLG